MNKSLPKIKISGFTLIELLVVIAIIAILATVSYSVFSGAQGSARDGVRRSQLQSIAKSIESARDYAGDKYTYDYTAFTADFPKASDMIPASDSFVRYCVYSGDTKLTTFPGSGTSCTGLAGEAPDVTFGDLFTLASGKISALANSISAKKYWAVCVILERTSVPYCQSSLN